jgi:hypothetical protein
MEEMLLLGDWTVPGEFEQGRLVARAAAILPARMKLFALWRCSSCYSSEQNDAPELAMIRETWE